MSGIGSMLTGASDLIAEHLAIKGDIGAEYRS